MKNLKSDYFLQLLATYLNDERLMNIFRYSKINQRKLKLGIDKYIKYHNNIEVEIIPQIGENVFFNNEYSGVIKVWIDNHEIKIPINKIENLEDAKVIKLAFNYKEVNINELFAFCDGIREISFTKCRLRNITNLNSLFSCCSNLKKVNFNKLNTKNVQDFSNMFYHCTSLEEFDLSSIDTSKAINMSFMFCYCSNLNRIILDNKNSSTITDLSGMFCHCEKLKKIKINNFNTINVINMSEMFCYCGNITELDLSAFNFSNVKNMEKMVAFTSNLKFINLSSLKKNKDINMLELFFPKNKNDIIIEIVSQDLLSPEAFI